MSTTHPVDYNPIDIKNLPHTQEIVVTTAGETREVVVTRGMVREGESLNHESTETGGMEEQGEYLVYNRFMDYDLLVNQSVFILLILFRQ